MIDRIVAVALVALSLVVVGAPAAVAQSPEPTMSEPDCGEFTPICEAIEEVEGGLGPVGDAVDQATDQLPDDVEQGINELVTALAGAVAELDAALDQVTGPLSEGACGPLAPIITGLQPVLSDAEGLIHQVTTTAASVVDELQPLVDEANELVEQVTQLCAQVQPGPSETATATASPSPSARPSPSAAASPATSPAATVSPRPTPAASTAPARSLPRTGPGVLGPGLGLGLVGLGALTARLLLRRR